MADPIRNLVNEKIASGRTTVRELEDFIRERLPKFVESEMERLVSASLRRQIRSALRDAMEVADESAQGNLELPGLPPPSAIPGVKKEGETTYVGYFHATWDDRQAHREEQRKNLEAATRHLWDEQGKDRYLAPVMQGNPEITVAEAVRLLKKESAA